MVYFAELCDQGRLRGLVIHLPLESFVAPHVGKQPMRSRYEVVRGRFGATIRERRKVDRDNAKLDMCMSMVQMAASYNVPVCWIGPRVAKTVGRPCGNNLGVKLWREACPQEDFVCLCRFNGPCRRLLTCGGPKGSKTTSESVCVCVCVCVRTLGPTCPECLDKRRPSRLPLVATWLKSF